MRTPQVKLSLTDAFVSFDDGHSWWRVRDDGTTTLQFRIPPHATKFYYGDEMCCDHDCSLES